MDSSQLPEEYGGTWSYNHDTWIQNRVVSMFILDTNLKFGPEIYIVICCNLNEGITHFLNSTHYTHKIMVLVMGNTKVLFK